MSSANEGIPLPQLLSGAAGTALDFPFSASVGAAAVGALLLILPAALCSVGCAAVLALNDAQRRAAPDSAALQKLAAHPRRLKTLAAAATGLCTALSAALCAWFICPSAAAALGASGVARAVGTLGPLLIDAFLMLLLGAVLPARMGAARAEELAPKYAGALRVMDVLLRPATAAADAIARGWMKLRGVDPSAADDAVTEEDILSMVDAGEETGSIEENTKDMISNIFDFSDTTVSEQMTHRTELTAVRDTDTVADVVRVAMRDGHSRIPVYHEDADNILGVIYVKDLLRFVGQPAPNIPLTQLMHKAYYVPEVKKCSELFTEMTEKKIQLAIVCDEYGGTSGVITMEDLIESIVGNIQDEYDDEQEEISRVGDDAFTVDGATALDEVSELIDTELPEGDYDTVAGFMVDQLGYIPQENQHPVVKYGGFTFTVQTVEDRRISRILIEKDAPAANAEQNDAAPNEADKKHSDSRTA